MSIADKSKAGDSGKSPVQMGEGKCIVPMPSCCAVPSGKAGMDAHEADAVL